MVLKLIKNLQWKRKYDLLLISSSVVRTCVTGWRLASLGVQHLRRRLVAISHSLVQLICWRLEQLRWYAHLLLGLVASLNSLSNNPVLLNLRCSLSIFRGLNCLEVKRSGFIKINWLTPIVDGLVGEVILLSTYKDLWVILDISQWKIKLKWICTLVKRTLRRLRLILLNSLRLSLSWRAIYRLKSLMAWGLRMEQGFVRCSSTFPLILRITLPLLCVRVCRSGSSRRGEYRPLILALSPELSIERSLLASLILVATIRYLWIIKGYNKGVANHIFIRRLGSILVNPRCDNILFVISTSCCHTVLGLYCVLLL